MLLVLSYIVITALCKAKQGSVDAPPNALAFSGGAPIDRQCYRADSKFQNRTDLAGAQRRPLQRLVGPPGRELYREYQRIQS